MTFSRHKSVRRVLGATLLLASLSLVLSPEILAEDPSEEEPQSLEEPTEEPAEEPADDVPVESQPESGASDVEDVLDAMIEEAKAEARENQAARVDSVKAESQKAEESADLSKRSYTKMRVNKETIAATSIGTVGGMWGGYFIPTYLCFMGADLSTFDDCLINPVVFGGTVLTGIAGGYLGYKNNRTVVTLGGALTGVGVGMALWLPANNDDILIPVVLLSAAAGGYLGHRLWKVREVSGSRYSLSPYWDQERSGLMVSGQF
jgi:hypothetical protein